MMSRFKFESPCGILTPKAAESLMFLLWVSARLCQEIEGIGQGPLGEVTADALSFALRCLR